MSDRVKMIHPDLPGQVIHPKANKANAYLAGGWELKPETPAEEAPNQGQAEDQPETPESNDKPEPRKRRSDATEKKEA